VAQFATNRNASYLLTGYESIFFILVVFVVARLVNRYNLGLTTKSTKILTVSLLIFFLLSNLFYLVEKKATNESIVCMLQTNFNEKIQAINHIYQQADGRPFSLDVANMSLIPPSKRHIVTNVALVIDWAIFLIA
jgi:hypothetical protein